MRLFSEDVDWGCRALIDTGAPITFFDRGMADALAIRIGFGATAEMKIFGGTWAVQFETIDIELVAAPEFRWSARVAFVRSPELKMPFQGVLGTDGFLDRHLVCFDKSRDYFTVEDAGASDEVAEAYPPADARPPDHPDDPYDPQWDRPTVY